MTKHISNRKLLKWFLKEEWRLFTKLFGKNNFMLFPVIIFIFSVILGAASPIIDVPLEYLSIMYFSLITIFGLQTGFIGFEAKDNLNNLIGATSDILYASKTLPIKKQTLILLFLIKDAIFYSIVFLAPITIGVLFGLKFSPIDSSYILNTISLNNLLITYIYTIIIFMFGVSVGFLFTTIRVERISGIVIFAALISFISIIYTQINITFDSILNISLYYWMIGIIFATILCISMGLIQFKNFNNLNVKSTFKNRYKKMSDIFTPTNNYTKIMLKNLIDVQRSSGGFLKIIFSATIIVITSYMLIFFMSKFFGLAAQEEFIYSSLFALMTYPLYNIMFRYDSIDTYSTLPISQSEVYKSKILLFTIIGVPISIILYTSFIISDISLISYIQGISVLLGLQYYQLGLLMYMGGDNPHRLLFNGLSFAIYSISTLIFIIPILIIGMYGNILISTLTGIIVFWGLFAGLIGVILIHLVLTNNKLFDL